MQRALELLEGGIGAMGGAIVPEKSHWCLIDFTRQQDNWNYETEAEAPV
jgi:hypothetical protein